MILKKEQKNYYKVLSLIFLRALSLSSTWGQNSSASLPTSFTGVQGTYWGTSPWGSGNCKFQDWGKPNGPRGLPAIAIAGNLYKGAKYCGGCLEVTSKEGITKRGIISDNCPSCPTNALDLSPDLWNSVTNNKSPGIETLSWKLVDCGFKENLNLITKDGVSVSWFAMQAAGSNRLVKALEVKPPGSATWLTTNREEYNYFTLGQNQQFMNNAKTASIKVTCADGRNITTHSVPIDQPQKVTLASGNC
ncbi:Non-catalytic module family EXPN [Phakopsora pachyrhizi]|uniref:Non-catalytic module family EXPN n=1 Tax=Phakopsora pachyrhizi TaxID=170000 RepID=A0AAV0ALL9_PHAPC|nr:Non-catalytic module family EXPN [Phakopsora pachyrhizi]CAH7668869.1 Non-catalytic module family EXPN [Phakopsora pachyrhizi]